MQICIAVQLWRPNPWSFAPSSSPAPSGSARPPSSSSSARSSSSPPPPMRSWTSTGSRGCDRRAPRRRRCRTLSRIPSRLDVPAGRGRRLALARAVRRPHEVEAIRAALGPCELTVVRLTAAPAVIAGDSGRATAARSSPSTSPRPRRSPPRRRRRASGTSCSRPAIAPSRRSPASCSSGRGGRSPDERRRRGHGREAEPLEDRPAVVGRVHLQVAVAALAYEGRATSATGRDSERPKAKNGGTRQVAIPRTHATARSRGA